ncbi:MAG: LysM peptidoglycan-binding domain-containing protein [Chitinophagaceae bacterium]
MKNKWLLICLCVLLANLGFAQNNDLQVQGVSPNLYLTHAVQAKETWYSIGRIYNVSPKQLAPYNSLSLDKALAIGQPLKIPLTAENFSQDGSKTADEVFVPVHHTIQEKEWLYRVSVNYNKVPVESLEKWNNINKDQAKAGFKLIVGYLKVKTGQSALAAQGETKIAHTNPVAVNTPEEKKPETKEQKKSAPPVVDNVDPGLVKNTTIKQETKPVITNPVATSTTSNPVLTSNSVTATRGSYFKGQYEESGKSVSGNSGIFKSTSGWSDGKFYALVNNIAVGTIIKVNNPVSGRAIFAKVLGNLPDMKESMGLIARVSDAAAAELDAAGAKFSVEVRY